MNDVEIAKAATLAADVIERQGWCQFKLVDEYERVCTLGALHRVPYIDVDSMVRIVREFLDLHNLIGWNDTPGRTEEEVIQMFRDLATKYSSDAGI